MVDAPQSARIGEVVEATSTSFVAQCYQLYGAPPLGSLVRTGDPSIQGVVYRVVTEPLDASRPVLARGESAVTEDEVFRANPQLERLLTSRFEVLILGHRGRGADLPVLPPLPPRVHAFVYACSPEETVRLAESPGWLRTLLSSNVPAADQVAAACLRGAAVSAPEPEKFLLHACREIAGELAGDWPRISAILRMVKE